MSRKITRRTFIKIAGIGAGGLVFSPALLGKVFQPQMLAESSTRIPTYCEVCFWKCAGWVHLDSKGSIWKITGNPEDPHSNGRLCPRGTGGIGMYYDEDRLQTPLIRVKRNGKQEFKAVDWPEALDLVAERLLAIKKKYGPESLALFTHGTGGYWFKHLLKAYGTASIAAPSYAQCRGPRETAFELTFGEGVGSPERTDLRDTRCLVLIGSHIGENMHNGQVQETAQSIGKNATIITVDPRFSVIAGKSKYWLAIRPGTDMALLLAWIHVLIKEDLYDKRFVAKYTYGFDALRQHVKSYTPEWAYGITTIPPDLIRKTAREMAHAAPATIVHPGRHVVWYGDDTQRLRAVAILNALLGSWGRRGGFYNPAKVHLPSYPTPSYPKPRLTWRDAAPGKYPFAALGLAQTLRDASLPDSTAPLKIKGWFINGTNLIYTLPQPERTIQALNNMEFVVAVDTMPMEITGYADVVLPECTYLERYDVIRTSGHREPFIALRAPAAPPRFNTRPGWWIAKELSKRLGLEAYFPWKNVEELLDWQLKQVGSSLAEMKRLGVKKFPRGPEELYPLENLPEYEFSTNTGKIELYSTALAEAGFDPLPRYTPHPEPPPGFYRLIYGRAPQHTFSRTTNNPNLFALKNENQVWVNPKIAREWDLHNGDLVLLENQDGKLSTFPVKVRVTERIRWDSVYLIHGFGHSASKLHRAYARGAADAELISQVASDPIMGGTGMRINFVTFRKVNSGENRA